jgi:hypothetical protein
LADIFEAPWIIVADSHTDDEFFTKPLFLGEIGHAEKRPKLVTSET